MDTKSVSLHVFPHTPDGAQPSCIRMLPNRLPGPLRGVLFDMCSVLYDDTVWRRWLLRLLTQLGLQTNYRSFFHLLDRDYLDAVNRGERRFEDAFESFLRSMGMSRGQIEEVQVAAQTRCRTIEASLRPLPGVRSIVARLAESGLILGAICNSELSASGLRDRMERLGLGRWFATVVSSFDLGRTMPDHECYRAALREMRLQANETAFVGHNTAELAGASAIGMATVAFNFDRDAQADIHLGRLEELLAALPLPSERLAAAG